MIDTIKKTDVLKKPELIHKAMAYDAELDAIYKQIDVLRKQAEAIADERDCVVKEMRYGVYLHVVA